MNHPASASLAPSVPSAGATRPLRERLSATPRLACEALARAINQGDLEAALACFAPGAALVGAEGTVAQGEHALRASLAQLIGTGAQVQIELAGVLVAQDLALAHERWTIAYGSERSRSPHGAQPTLVLRQLAGEWKLAIAAPWGQAASPPLEAVWP